MLAIVIPYYKHDFFEETLKSLSNQTDKRFHVYIGDDASPKPPNELLEKYKTQFSFTYHRFPSNVGGKSLVKQWERCLKMVADEIWVQILGDDDALGETVVSSFYENMDKIEKEESCVIRFATQVINAKNDIVSKTYVHPKLEKSTDFLIRKLQGGTRSSLCEFVFKRYVLEDVKFKNLPLAWYSDYLAVLECTNFGTIYTINESVVFFRSSGLNISSKTNDLNIKNIATFNFYYYLLKEKSYFFKKDQLDKLFFTIEKTFLDNKKNIGFWVRLTKLYIVKFKIVRYIKFILSAGNSIINKTRND